MNILAVIPARSGSKSVKDKNIRNINGKPMLAYSIEHAQKSRYIHRIIVSTDSQQYADIAKEYGAEVPFIRPAEYATDTALDYDVFWHCLEYLKEEEGYEADIVVQLRPTYPIRDIKDIDAMIEMLLENKEADSVRSLAPAREIPYKMWHKDEDGRITPLIQEIPECYNMPRQELPKVYYQNACIDVFRGSVVLEKHSMSGDYILGYEMAHNYDIDTEEEFQRAEVYLEITKGKKRFVFDIDGVVAQFEPDLDYKVAKPNDKMIKIINHLYELGNEIVLFTARGYVTGIDWSGITQEQLGRWGVKYHQLLFGKPNADYYIDDKMLEINKLYNIFNI
ncbi:acylneuraminate cytidylyltransferase family protein [[Clostridium] polysaccharolyticum]|jgi:CMP-N-acetylneuraminic acid synthetase|uniref:N-acylneuraminate cytidylyltransferase n=1 Tax=[Clostridium] polysaccharolyticum TaxID=29364 RepID=A0A1I0CWB7_9FIRM|nr:acylneuraminate cytidylyltransferase family protein [[Clostridium] polysaccharolyticum]SET23408.1 CMP-N-acetylneuraminic acid synthetase [[Clostridium] polysaccharolyticum]